MKIAHVTSCYLPRLGGIEMHVDDLAARQRSDGHDVHVLTSSPGPSDAFVTRLSEQFRRPHPLHPGAVGVGARSIAAGGYDIVHAHVGVGSPVASLIARTAARSGIPTVFTVHSIWAGYRPMMSVIDDWGGWSRLPIVWTAVSAAAASHVRRVIGADRTVRVIPNGIDQAQWQLPAAPSKPDEVVLATVMRLCSRKRPLALLHMVRQAQKRLGPGLRLRLLVAGDGPRQGDMQRYLRRHHMSDAVSLRGRIDREQVHQMLGEAQVFAAPANLESFGIAALEARCVGLPVVAKSSGGVREFVRHEREGLLCDSDEQMVGALVRLARDAQLRERIAAHNRTTHCDVRWRAVLERTESAYRAACDARSRRGISQKPTNDGGALDASDSRPARLGSGPAARDNGRPPVPADDLLDVRSA